MTRNRLYLIVIIACFFGTLYFIYHLNSTATSPSVCIIKNITSYPCPSCGTTRAVVLLSKGKFIPSILQNPFGLIVGFCMLVFPFWIAFDVIKNKATFHQFYSKTEHVIRKPKVALVLILLVILNWIWNLYKHI